MIKTVIFDLGNVLVFFSLEKAVTQISEVTGLSLSTIKELLTGEKQLQYLYETGQVGSLELYQTFIKQSPRFFTMKTFFHAASDIFQPNLPMLSLLKELKQKKLRLILLSNTSPAHFAYLHRCLPDLSLFDKTVLSYEVGALKPAPPIYEAALQEARALPQECFYTDDIPEFVLAAKSHGIDAEVFTDTDSTKKHLENRLLL